MNEIVNKFLLAGDKFMPEMHLKQSISLGKSGFTNGACRPFTKKEEIIKKFKDTGDTKYIYKNELDKACLQHDMPYGDFKDLARRTASDKTLRDNAFNTAKSPKCDGYQRGLLSMVYKFFDKRSAGSGIKYQITQNKQLAEQFHQPIPKKFKRGKVYSSFKDNTWGTDLADMQLISKLNKEIRLLLCVINIFSK